MKRSIILLLSLFTIACASAAADSTTTTERTVTQLAPNVYEIRHPDAPDGFPQSNTTVVIGDRGVLVVDSCLLPSTAKQDIEQIKNWTNKPVTFLLNTHWHFDHTIGNATYAAAFPNVQIIAQNHTLKTIRDYNPGAMARYPTRAQRFKKILDEGKSPDGKTLTEGDRKDYEKALAGLSPVVAEFQGTTQLVPNVGFDREMTIDLGGTEAQLKFIGRGNTGGDTIVYLPKQKILVTGDLVDHPVPYMFGQIAVDYVDTLDRLLAFDAATIVPGHGDILRDKQYIRDVQAMVRTVNEEVERQVNAGKTLEEAQDIVPKNLAAAIDGWHKKFAVNAEDTTFFDQSFAGLVKSAYNQIRMR